MILPPPDFIISPFPSYLVFTINPRSMFDMMKMMGKMKEVQARIKEAQDNLVNVTATGESGGGMVKATANGKRQLIALGSIRRC